jgi:hypothetical protein
MVFDGEHVMVDDGAPPMRGTGDRRLMSSMTTAIRLQRAVREMTVGEVIAAIDHLTVGSTRISAREKLARLR